jgi:actin, other eukaryote
LNNFDHDCSEYNPEDSKLAKDKELFIGEDAQNNLELLNIYSPVSEGQIKDLSMVEKMLQYSVYEMLKTSPEEHPWLLTETFFSKDTRRLELTEMMFNMNVPCFYIQKQEVLALYSAGKTTG